MYCELTVQYMVLVWEEGLLPEKIGFMHYRRFLDFSNPKTLRAKFKKLLVYLDSRRGAGIKLTQADLRPKDILRAVQDADLLVPMPWDVRLAGYSSVRDQYVSAPSHFESDWDICGSVIRQISPELYAQWAKLDTHHLLYPGNIYIMQKALFVEYGALLFKILEKVRAGLNFDTRSIQEKRALGYLAERIFTAFVGLKKEEGKISISALPLILIKP
jgi:hypothetical protein